MIIITVIMVSIFILAAFLSKKKTGHNLPLWVWFFVIATSLDCIWLQSMSAADYVTHECYALCFPSVTIYPFVVFVFLILPATVALAIVHRISK